jgi:serine phosphatase RsbU (regulator of sigma subunit)/putative methionine-R-sulfoxide reductase with GAF domain
MQSTPNFFGLPWWMVYIALFAVIMITATYILLRRYRSRQLLMRRIAELESLSEAGRAIVEAELDLDALCALIARAAGDVIDNSTFQVGLFDLDMYEIRYWRINGQLQDTPRTFNLSEEGGIVGWMRQSKEPLLVTNFERELHRLPAKPRYVSNHPPKSAVFIPLVSGEQTIGIVAAQSEQPKKFTEEDMRRLMILANQAAAAIAHARLFAQVQRRAALLELVGQIGRQISRIQDLHTIFQQVVHLTAQTFNFHLVSIYEWQTDTANLTLQASNQAEMHQLWQEIEPGQGLVGSAAHSHQTIISNNTREDTRYVSRQDQLEQPTRAEMAIPLLIDDELVGVLDVQSPEEGFFTHIEKTTLEALAAEVAIAISKMRQLTQQREQAWVTAAQFQVAELIGCCESVEELAHTVAQSAQSLLQAPACTILLWQEETAVYHTISPTIPTPPSPLPLGSWHALDAVHVGHETLPTTQMPPWPLPPTIDHWLLLPLKTTAQYLGIMAVGQQNQPTIVSPQRCHDLLHNIADQLAKAVENTQLRTAQQEEAWVNTALFQVAATVNSLINLNEILATIIRLVPMLVGVDSALILIWDEKSATFYPGPSYGVDPMGLGLLGTLAIDQDEIQQIVPGILNESAKSGKPQFIPLSHWLVKVFHTPQACALPLVARGQLVGVLLVGTDKANGRRLTTRHLNILTGIAHQAATAVVNAHLYAEATERSRLEKELDVARQIQANLIPTGSPPIPGLEIASFWEAARQVSGDFYDFFPLADGKWGILIADVADKGFPAALFMALSRTILRTIALNRLDPAETLMRANEIMDNDAQSDLFVTVFYAIWDPTTRLLSYANGGHNPPMLLQANGHTQLLSGNGMALGVLPTIELNTHTITMKTGDTLIFYTDGITEAMNENYDEFGISRLRLSASNHHQNSATTTLQAIQTAVQLHTGDAPQFDDMTLIIAKVQSKKHPHPS